MPNSRIRLLSILALTISVVPLFFITPSNQKASAECQPDAPVPALRLVTEMESYSLSYEYATMVGQVSKDVIVAGQNVTLRVYSPDGLVTDESIQISPTDGRFTHVLLLNPLQEKRLGRYNVTAAYGSYLAEWSFVVWPGVVDYSAAGVGKPQLHGIYGNSIPEDIISSGQQVVFSTEIKNLLDWRDQPVVAILEVRDGDGVTVYLGLQSGILNPGCSKEFGFSWIAEQQGSYQVRSFALSSWTEPSVLSIVSSMDFDVV